ncbi:mCG148344 [Mus musculus]|jgi:hypothetical protein|nr:mCG148344 [Mus musculus]
MWKCKLNKPNLLFGHDACAGIETLTNSRVMLPFSTFTHSESKSMFWFLFVCFVFQDRVSLYSPGCPGTHFVDQAGLELRNPPASASQVLGLKACAATTTWQKHGFYVSFSVLYKSDLF